MEQRRCICIFSALYAPSTGGVEIFTENLSAELARIGHEVIIVSSNTHGSPDEETVNGVRIMRLPCRPLLNGRLPLPVRNAKQRTLLRKLEAMPIDSMLINTRFYPHSQIGAELAEKKGIRPILLDHGSAYLTLGNPLLDAALKAYEHAMTARIKRHDMDYYGISQASVQWLSHFGILAMGAINNAMDADAFMDAASNRDFRSELGLSEDAFLVAFTGRLVPEKGVSSLMAAADILRSNENVHIVLAGDGPLLSLVQAAGSNVHALGRTSREDIAALLMQADAFCLPTRSEGFSTSLLEAAVCSCVPIITRVGGVEELIGDDSRGIILPDAEPETIAASINALSADRARAASMGQRIASHAKKTFTWPKTADRVMHALQQADRERR